MKKLAIRYEEIPTVGGFVLADFITDKADFIAFSDVYDGAFQTNFETKLNAVNNVVSTRFHRKVIEQITLKQYLDIKLVRPMIRVLKRYVELAQDDTNMTPRQFGIIAVTKELARRDMERLNQAMKELFENVDNYMTELSAVGYSATKYAELKAMKTEFYNLNLQQNVKMNEKELAVKENETLFSEVVEMIADIQRTGKALYCITNKTKMENSYTMATILNRIRQERSEEQKEIKKIESECAIYVNYMDEEGNPLAEVRSTVAEYELTVEADEDGEAYHEAVPTNPFDKVTIKSELEGFLPDIQSEVALVKGGEVEVTVVMKKIL
jgi:hypothetical protein